MRAWRRDIPEQTVVRRGSSVFCEAKVPKPNGSEHIPAHTVGEKGRLFGLMPEEGAT